MPIVAPPVVRPTVVVYKDFLLSIGGVVDEWPQKGIYKFVDGEADRMKVGEIKMGRYRHGVVPGPVEIWYIIVCCWRICAELSRWRRRQL